ncbi:unnamed protein product [Phytophthora lilii]|uniref:Unnamed protein product n=1 Tax=Phytophthora lilii TaxID=2077276 RepID=A0A9W6XEG6_9STRA|nr:unnamed protein product [Phytophthora lilii]
MGFDNIDDVKNGLLLFKPLKHAFDHFQMSFIYDKGSNEFRLKVFDPSLRRQRLFAKLHPDQRDLLLRGQTLSKHWKKRGPRLAPGTDFNIQTTFGDVESQPLCFMSVERPYKRCLNLQARLGRKKAIEAKWIHPDENEFEDFWSEGMSLAEKMDFFSARDS